MHTRNVSVLSSSVHWAYSWYTVPWNDGLALNNLLFFPVWHGRHKKFHKWSVYFKTFKSQNLTHNLHCTGQLCCFDHVTPPLSLLAWELSIKKWWLSSHQFTTDLKIFYLWTYVHCEKFNFDVCISLTYQYFYYHYPGEFAWLTDMVLSAVLPQLHHNPSTLTPQPQNILLETSHVTDASPALAGTIMNTVFQRVPINIPPWLHCSATLFVNWLTLANVSAWMCMQLYRCVLLCVSVYLFTSVCSSVSCSTRGSVGYQCNWITSLSSCPCVCW